MVVEGARYVDVVDHEAAGDFAAGVDVGVVGVGADAGYVRATGFIQSVSLVVIFIAGRYGGWNSRGKKPAGPCNHSNRDIITLLDLAQLVAKLVVQVHVQRIQLFGPIDGDNRNAVEIFHRDRILRSHFAGLFCSLQVSSRNDRLRADNGF